jgi:predicted RNase H-like nuclease (RuvC/YqgF family)
MTDNSQSSGAGTCGVAGEAESRLQEKVRILERHCDHLMGQLYHQVEIIRSQRDHAAHIAKELESIKDTPRLLDDALKKISQLKEELAGRKEVELDLRRRVEDLEREESAKVAHIKKLENYLSHIWYSPHRRFARSIKNFLRRLLGRNPTPSDLSGGDPQ